VYLVALHDTAGRRYFPMVLLGTAGTHAYYLSPLLPLTDPTLADTTSDETDALLTPAVRKPLPAIVRTERRCRVIPRRVQSPAAWLKKGVSAAFKYKLVRNPRCNCWTV
jgi:hypothetical protein